jgi:hypothetical protein
MSGVWSDGVRMNEWTDGWTDECVEADYVLRHAAIAFWNLLSVVSSLPLVSPPSLLSSAGVCSAAMATSIFQWNALVGVKAGECVLWINDMARAGQ